MVNINGTLKAVGYALLVLFFLMGVMKHYNSFSEVRRPEQAIKLFLRFVLAKAAITWGLDLMMAIFRIVQGVIGKIMTASGIGGQGNIYLPDSMVQTIEDCGFWESIPLWAVTADRQSAHYRAVLCHDSDCIRALLQIVYVCCHFAPAACDLCK